jgi:hypothetical protein
VLLNAASAGIAVGFPAGSALAASISNTSPEQNMASPTVTQRLLQVEHIQIETPKKFADAEAALERSVPQFNPAIVDALAKGDEPRATELEQGAPLRASMRHCASSSMRTKKAVQSSNTTNRRLCSVSLTTNRFPQSPKGSMSRLSARCEELRNSLTW